MRLEDILADYLRKIMNFTKKLISLILLFSLILSMLGGIGTAYAVEPSEPAGFEETDPADCCEDDDKDDCASNVENDGGNNGENKAEINEDPDIDLLDLITASGEYDLIQQFVSRMYLDALDRPYDTGGLNHWTGVLRAGIRTGAGVAFDFYFSREFRLQNVSDSEFLDRMYRGLMDRTSDTRGKTHWMNLLTAGLPRENVFAEFVNSFEFSVLCTRAGFIRGTYTPPSGGMARIFAKRLYTETFDREPSLADLNYWHNELRNGMTGSTIAYRFIFGTEMHERDLSDEQFIDVLYRALLGRASDSTGRNHWVRQLQNGNSRYSVFVSFAATNEFGRMCNDHGISRGTAPQPANMMNGTTMVARVWNLIVLAQIRGISDRPEHIAGITGNLQSEAGLALCPFQQQVSNGVGLGLMQWSFGRRTNLENFMWARGIDPDEFTAEVSKHLTSVCNNPIAHHPSQILDRVLEAQINFMFHELRNTSERIYLDYIEFPANKSGVPGARAYAELFCVLAERPGVSANVIDEIQDEGVLLALTASPYFGGPGVINRPTTFMGLETRRNRAANVYQLYLTNSR